MLEFLRLRLRQGTPTSPFPGREPGFPERFRGLPVVEPAPGAPPFDVGACLFAPEEGGEQAAGTVRFSQDFRMAASTRDALRAATGRVELAGALDEKMRRLFGRSLRLRSVVAGSCGGCEAELNAMSNVVFDMARFGIQFVASPRHADGIVITGVVNRNMSEALRATYEATPGPRIVIAVGACAIAGGPFAGSPEIAEPLGIPIDLYVPGCPPHPLTVLDGLLRLLGRLPEDRVRAAP
ncbi:MAG: hydrogenase [Gemmatimonadota bacterium]|nr:hydrogenase [Gemmatimonadota bacterium]